MFGLLFYLDRKPDRRHGLYSALTLLLYPPVRFGFDFAATDMEEFGEPDVRWAGLTPAQYGSIVLFCLGIWILFHRQGKPQQDLSQEVARDFKPGLFSRRGRPRSLPSGAGRRSLSSCFLLGSGSCGPSSVCSCSDCPPQLLSGAEPPVVLVCASPGWIRRCWRSSRPLAVAHAASPGTRRAVGGPVAR